MQQYEINAQVYHRPGIEKEVATGRTESGEAPASPRHFRQLRPFRKEISSSASAWGNSHSLITSSRSAPSSTILAARL